MASPRSQEFEDNLGTGDSVLKTEKSSKSTSTGYSVPTPISKETHLLVQKSKICLSIMN